MAKLPATRRVIRSDIPGAEPWIDPLLSIYNNNNQAIYEAVNGRLTFPENIYSFKKTLTFTTGSTYSGGVFPDLRFTNELDRQVDGVFLRQIYLTGTNYYTPIKSGVYIDWQEVNGEVIIGYISGLANSKEYTVKVLVI